MSIIINPKINISFLFLIGFLNKVGLALNKKLKLTGGNISQVQSFALPQSIRPVFNGRYHRFHGLQILINDTEETNVEMFNFYYNPTNGYWEAGVFVTIYDHFGLDTQNIISYLYNGFYALKDNLKYLTAKYNTVDSDYYNIQDDIELNQICNGIN